MVRKTIGLYILGRFLFNIAPGIGVDNFWIWTFLILSVLNIINETYEKFEKDKQQRRAMEAMKKILGGK